MNNRQKNCCDKYIQKENTPCCQPENSGFALAYYIIGIGIITSGLILTTIFCYNKFEKLKKKKDKSNEKELSKV